MSELLVQYGVAIIMMIGMLVWWLGEGRRRTQLDHIATAVAELEARLAVPSAPPGHATQAPVQNVGQDAILSYDRRATAIPIRKAVLTAAGVLALILAGKALKLLLVIAVVPPAYAPLVLMGLGMTFWQMDERKKRRKLDAMVATLAAIQGQIESSPAPTEVAHVVA